MACKVSVYYCCFDACVFNQRQAILKLWTPCLPGERCRFYDKLKWSDILSAVWFNVGNEMLFMSHSLRCHKMSAPHALSFWRQARDVRIQSWMLRELFQGHSLMTHITRGNANLQPHPVSCLYSSPAFSESRTRHTWVIYVRLNHTAGGLTRRTCWKPVYPRWELLYPFNIG